MTHSTALRVNPERSRSFQTRIIEGLICCGYGILLGLVLATVPTQADVQPLRAHFIDVGYADAILLEFPPPAGRGLSADATTMLVDAGDARHSSRLMSYLKVNQIRRIDTVVITHPHQNHFGGLRKVAGRIPIGRVFHNGDPDAEKGYSALLAYLERRHVPVEIVRRGQTLQQLPASVTVEVLNPPDLNDSPNNNALALRIKHGRVSLLLLADIGPDRQDALLQAFPDIRQADCVLIPHHGGPLGGAFIEAFQGKLLIVSTGPNRWGLPREDQLKKLSDTIYRTDKDGTIVVESDGVALKVVSWTQNDH
ncbi:MAG: hypothetical protein A2705_00305 [Omnitrophica WOR_2 bacterium RIFCSPHIGHO2_01_FULL_52_10]|nr:MAG: hypothetical protein A2705_00305 [Omnitrophica WOR_2 bacterium RIFCSPHIGHO2_01_FULL_52_10]